jgi:hypothetical protein
MSIDIIALLIFLLGLSFWTGVLHNKVCNLTKRLDKNDATTDKVPELMVQLSQVIDTLKEIKADIHDMKDDMAAMKTDIEVMKK